MYCSGTHLGDFQGLAPTGKHVKIASFDMFRIADGKLVEHWSISDSLGMMQQLGLIPVSSQARG
jgi:predicted ester cyclase